MDAAHLKALAARKAAFQRVKEAKGSLDEANAKQAPLEDARLREAGPTGADIARDAVNRG